MNAPPPRYLTRTVLVMMLITAPALLLDVAGATDQSRICDNQMTEEECLNFLRWCVQHWIRRGGTLLCHGDISCDGRCINAASPMMAVLEDAGEVNLLA